LGNSKREDYGFSFARKAVQEDSLMKECEMTGKFCVVCEGPIMKREITTHTSGFDEITVSKLYCDHCGLKYEKLPMNDGRKMRADSRDGL